jgi:predicted dehydrogenase
MQKIYQLGIVGFGGMAGHHVNQLAKGNTRVRVKGIYDINPDRMKAAEEKGYSTYPSLEAMLADPEVDIVLVAAYNNFHKDLSIQAMRAGKHVLCEKPVTMTSEELKEVMAVAEETGKVFTIDQNRRVNKDYVAMRNAIESGAIGKPYYIETRVEGSRGMPEGWRCHKKEGGGMMLDWGVHLIDQMLYMFDEKVTSIYCKMYSVHYPEVDDNFRLIMTFESGMTAQVEVSTNNFILHPRWYVLCEGGTLQIDDWSGVGRMIRPIADQSQWSTEIAPDKAGPSKTMAKRDPSTVETIEFAPPAGLEDNLDPTYYQLVDAIEGAPLKITPQRAMRCMLVMEAAFRSAETGEAVKVNI